jgi:hypothetical protein
LAPARSWQACRQPSSANIGVRWPLIAAAAGAVVIGGVAFVVLKRRKGGAGLALPPSSTTSAGARAHSPPQWPSPPWCSRRLS